MSIRHSRSRGRRSRLSRAHLRWLITPELLVTEHLPVCINRVAAACALCPHAEDVIYIITDSDQVIVQGEVSPIPEGSAAAAPISGAAGEIVVLGNARSRHRRPDCRDGEQRLRIERTRYHAIIAISNKRARSSSEAGRGDSFVTLCCGSVPFTSAGMSSVV